MTRRNRVLLISAATALGCAALILYTKISKDIIFNGLRYCSLQQLDVVLGPAALLTSASFSGFLASLIVIRKSLIPHMVMSLYVMAKMFFASTCPDFSSPLWFDATLNAALLSGIWLGHYMAEKFPLAPI